MSRALDH